MPTKRLTELFVARVKPPARGRVEYFDAAFPGLALRVTAKGRKSWCTFYRFNGRLRRFTIGAYPAIKPAQARREAAAALDRARGGIDPAIEKRARRYARARKPTHSVPWSRIIWNGTPVRIPRPARSKKPSACWNHKTWPRGTIGPSRTFHAAM